MLRYHNIVFGAKKKEIINTLSLIINNISVIIAM